MQARKIDPLERLGKLFRSGELTYEEFETLRDKILWEQTDASITVPDAQTPGRALPKWVPYLGYALAIFWCGILIGYYVRVSLSVKLNIRQQANPALETFFEEGDYNSARNTCEEKLKYNPGDSLLQECASKAKKQLNRLAKESYTHAYILESMNRIEESKQYLMRAKAFVRPGDDYYDKVMKKIEYHFGKK